jgi:hypothetical protein
MKVGQDLHNNVRTKMAIVPQAMGNGTAFAGNIIDRKGYGSVEFDVAYGSITTTGTTVTALVKEGDATGSLTSVADGDLLGTEALVGLAAGARVAGTGKEVAKRIGYKGNKRYVQLTLTRGGTTSAGAIGANAILSSPEAAPVANP